MYCTLYNYPGKVEGSQHNFKYVYTRTWLTLKWSVFTRGQVT